mmetsp:Transcript_28724/g.66267  ORF Transcript_28724/g.66267 Transcript_28724/m.66267 type:complete len:239 (-) Transcript_28724:456-1172(-)
MAHCCFHRGNRGLVLGIELRLSEANRYLERLLKLLHHFIGLGKSISDKTRVDGGSLRGRMCCGGSAAGSNNSWDFFVNDARLESIEVVPQASRVSTTKQHQLALGFTQCVPVSSTWWLSTRFGTAPLPWCLAYVQTVDITLVGHVAATKHDQFRSSCARCVCISCTGRPPLDLWNCPSPANTALRVLHLQTAHVVSELAVVTSKHYEPVAKQSCGMSSPGTSLGALNVRLNPVPTREI